MVRQIFANIALLKSAVGHFASTENMLHIPPAAAPSCRLTAGGKMAQIVDRKWNIPTPTQLERFPRISIAVATSDGAEASQEALPESVFEPLSVS
jgi:hypothetical protein